MSDWIALEKEIVKQADHYPVTIPDSKKGKWSVSTIDLTDEWMGLENLRKIRDGMAWACVSPGRYKRLVGPNGLAMSNTQMEYRTNRVFVDMASGDVLVTGLGLGMILRPLFANGEVNSVTVIEKEQDVIDLVAPHYADLGPELQIICADAYTWKPALGTRFTCAWHDIWSDFGSEHVALHSKIKKHYRPYVEAFQMCWVEGPCKQMKARGW